MNWICKILRHEPIPIWTTKTCNCTPGCKGTYSFYIETRCRRCWDLLP